MQVQEKSGGHGMRFEEHKIKHDGIGSLSHFALPFLPSTLSSTPPLPPSRTNFRAWLPFVPHSYPPSSCFPFTHLSLRYGRFYTPTPPVRPVPSSIPNCCHSYHFCIRRIHSFFTHSTHLHIPGTAYNHFLHPPRLHTDLPRSHLIQKVLCTFLDLHLSSSFGAERGRQISVR